MRAQDIMTRHVISVTPDTSVLEAAALMVEQRINAVVVTSGDAVVGVVSEANLLHRYELGTQRDPAARSWWHRLFGADRATYNYVEAHAMKVGDVMAKKVITVEEDTPAADIAALFDEHKIKQAPVVRAGALVGIVSRADFVRALVTQAKSAHPTPANSDKDIKQALLAELQGQPWWHSNLSRVTVSGGIVRFIGQVSASVEKAPARVAAENIAGVRAVEDNRSVVVPSAGYPSGGYL